MLNLNLSEYNGSRVIFLNFQTWHLRLSHFHTLVREFKATFQYNEGLRRILKRIDRAEKPTRINAVAEIPSNKTYMNKLLIYTSKYMRRRLAVEFYHCGGRRSV